MNLGIMQGRLSPPVGGRIQAFPHDNWKSEFHAARSLGLTAIEWIFESPIERNPLWSDEGLDQIRQVIAESGVAIEFVCADYFMESPFVRMSDDVRDRNREILNRVLAQAVKLGARAVEIPFVDPSEIRNASEEDEVLRALEPGLAVANELGILVGLETSLSADRFENLLRRFSNPAIRANYDIGNSASLGYDPVEEIGSYGRWIENVHIKDRVLGGTTVPLGTGDARLAEVFRLLHDQRYSGGYTLQAARGPDELDTVRGYMKQVRTWISNSKTNES